MAHHKYMWTHEGTVMPDVVFNVLLEEGSTFVDSRSGHTYVVVLISKVSEAEREGLIITSSGKPLPEEQLAGLRGRQDIDPSWPYVVLPLVTLPRE